MKKGDISTSTIIYIIIGALVLVLIAIWLTGGFGAVTKGIQTGSPGELEMLKNKCIQNCNMAKSSVQTAGASAWGNSIYCTTPYAFDTNGDGAAESINCWQNPVNVKCSIPKGEVTCEADATANRCWCYHYECHTTAGQPWESTCTQDTNKADCERLREYPAGSWNKKCAWQRVEVS